MNKATIKKGPFTRPTAPADPGPVTWVREAPKVKLNLGQAQVLLDIGDNSPEIHRDMFHPLGGLDKGKLSQHHLYLFDTTKYITYTSTNQWCLTTTGMVVYELLKDMGY